MNAGILITEEEETCDNINVILQNDAENIMDLAYDHNVVLIKIKKIS